MIQIQRMGLVRFIQNRLQILAIGYVLNTYNTGSWQYRWITVIFIKTTKDFMYIYMYLFSFQLNLGKIHENNKKKMYDLVLEFDYTQINHI